MDSDNPYQAPPEELPRAESSRRELGYWLHAFIVFKLSGAGLIAMVTWFANSPTKLGGSGEALYLLWGLLAWTTLGAALAIGVAFRLRLAKHLLVVQLVVTAAAELYAFASMMNLDAPGPLKELAFNFGWSYFVMAVWDLGWAALFQFSRSLKQALN